MRKQVTIIPCDYANIEHTVAVVMLLNAYIADKMGGGRVLDKDDGKRLTESLKAHQKSIVLLAFGESGFVGLLVAFENISTFAARAMINIHDVVVLSKFRAGGVGRALMEAVICEAKKRECVRVTLEVRKDNEIAQNLYKDLGFKEAEPAMFFWKKELDYQKDI
jgi:ribosomal protein S18 acetylase RimI-like enzyme